MAYYSSDYNYQPRRHDSYGYSSASKNSYPQYPSYAFHDPSYAAYDAAPSLPTPSSRDRDSSYRTSTRRVRSWPPSPSVEEETASLAREVPTRAPATDEPPAQDSRGTVDQYPIILENENYKPVRESSDDRRYVLVSDPKANVDESRSSARDYRRRSFAERGNMAPLDTGANDPPVFTERTSTPYAYTKPAKESLAPSADYTLSPEPIAPSSSAVPRSIPKGDSWDAQRDQTRRQPRPYAQSPREVRNDVFEESDSDDATYLRTERKPARYSFVKSDLQKEDLRTSLRDSQAPIDPKRPGRSTPYSSSGSSRNPTPRTQSPNSTSSSRNNTFYSRQNPSITTPPSPSVRTPSSRPTSPSPRPSSPQSPNLPPRRNGEYTQSRTPYSRPTHSRPSSPLHGDAPGRSQVQPITEADWHATYPPVAANDKPAQNTRLNRHESMPVPAPRIDVQSPSPARPPKPGPSPSLPYPDDDRVADVYMPPVEAYQFDHSYAPPSPGPRSPYPDSPRVPQSPIPAFSRLSVNGNEQPRTRVRSDSVRSQSNDSRRTNRRALGSNGPLPSCPRSELSDEYEDWYTLESCPNFDICPSCYRQVFEGTEISDYFRPVIRHDLRVCDFALPWFRLAWLITLKQQRDSPDLIYQLAAILDQEADCPKDRARMGGEWYGIPDPRDGVHVANFSICRRDWRMLETLCPRIRGYLTRLQDTGHYDRMPPRHMCAFRTTSKRFSKYLDLLVELDNESRATNRPPDMARFVKLAREYAFKSECQREKPLFRTAWHFIPSLPEFTVCEECYDDLVWPAIRQNNSVAKLFNRTTRLVPDEGRTGTTCCLYSPRMRRIWATTLEDEDFGYLKRKAMDRKQAEDAYLTTKTRLEDMLRTGAATYRERDLMDLDEMHKLTEEDWMVVK